MTNQQIVVNSVLDQLTPEKVHADVLTIYGDRYNEAAAQFKNIDGSVPREEVVDAYLFSAHLHTFPVWKRKGRHVKAGEKTLIKTTIWVVRGEDKKKLEEEGEEGRPEMVKRVVNLFSVLQTEENTTPENVKPVKASSYGFSHKMAIVKNLDMAAFTADFGSVYTWLYDHNDNEKVKALISKYAAAFDDCKEYCFKRLLEKFNDYREDFVASDREAAAFMSTYAAYMTDEINELRKQFAPAPVEVAPVEVAPVEAAPVEVAPVEAAPVEVDDRLPHYDPAKKEYCLRYGSVKFNLYPTFFSDCKITAFKNMIKYIVISKDARTVANLQIMLDGLNACAEGKKLDEKRAAVIGAIAKYNA